MSNEMCYLVLPQALPRNLPVRVQARNNSKVVTHTPPPQPPSKHLSNSWSWEGPLEERRRAYPPFSGNQQFISYPDATSSNTISGTPSRTSFSAGPLLPFKTLNSLITLTAHEQLNYTAYDIALFTNCFVYLP